ncbi:hypothetical protein BASA50_001179 [Batrachochytrium salamandrivorans]|uniref:Uncharacterized protein n=1 Tax=Batrachochytrium salamandrivorans TaxID=1357716 RepID=A0ABQ8EUU9_9FUNG|nr:hypothetical protein BASA50_001179 [Batrachochytrium salamandrivorans]
MAYEADCYTVYLGSDEGGHPTYPSPFSIDPDNTGIGWRIPALATEVSASQNDQSSIQPPTDRSQIPSRYLWQQSNWDAISARTSATAPTTPMATVASTLTSASVLKVAAAAVTTAVAAAASSHSSVRRRSKATGISGTQHAVSIAVGY